EVPITVVAGVPIRVALAGSMVVIWPLSMFHPGAQTVNFAIRRYATCEVTTRADRRIVLISQDPQVRETYESLMDLGLRASKLPLLRELVMFFEPRRGIKIKTPSQLPAGAGLGGSSALNIALCGALARVAGKDYSPPQLL